MSGGELTLEGNDNGTGIVVGNTLSVSDGKLHISRVTEGINSDTGSWNDAILISGGEVLIDAVGYAFEIQSDYTEVTISGGVVTLQTVYGLFYRSGSDLIVEPASGRSIVCTYGDSATAIDGTRRVDEEDIRWNVSAQGLDESRYFHTEAMVEESIVVGGVELHGSTIRPAYAKTDADGNVTLADASEDDHNIKWDGETLTLSNSTIQTRATGSLYNDVAAVYFQSAIHDLTVEFIGENTILGMDHAGQNVPSYNYGIYSEQSDIRMDGEGTLTIEVGDTSGGSAFSNTRVISAGIYANQGSVEVVGGTITIDGKDIQGISTNSLFKKVSIVFQDVTLFNTSVMENIRLGDKNASDAQVMEAARLAGCDEFISKLPEGYDTKITNNGESLSQGQRQLLSIARAAIADPPVLVMDEATSSIDTHTEALVQSGMDKLMANRTVFVIAHRLSTVRNSDAIMVLDHGRIIERGTHDQLIAQHGVYYQLYTGAVELE